MDPIKEMHQNQKDQVQILPTPVKSASDQKAYKVIRLPNGLTACLISDPTALNDECEKSDSDHGTDESSGTCKKESQGDDEQKVHSQKMAAAALCVGVGSFSDPKTIPGLAHFLEHMVFLGSEKFPQENDFASFISTRGGSWNANTHDETTIFYFQCFKNDLCKGLDKFAQIFISPLMSRSSITREREAVDSEFQQKVPNDTLRSEQLLRNLAKKDSPANTFIWGNLKTLRDDVQLSALYEALHEFRKRHYSAHRMTLAIEAGLPIELLETYVLDCFSDVPCNKMPSDDFSKFKDCYDTPEDTPEDTREWNKIYFLEPTNDTNMVKITFALPASMYKYKTKPDSYVTGILGDEGKGSLISYLRKKVWALFIQTGSQKRSLYWLVYIYIHLTAEGLENLCTIIETVFSFINMMKTLGPQESIFNEMKQIKDISFRFAAEQSVLYNVQKMVYGMRAHPPKDYLTGPDLLYNPEDIKMVMDHLVPRKANITVLTKTSLVFEELNQGDPIQYDKVGKWCGTRYADFIIPEELFFRWENARPLEEFALPLPNQFIAENFEIVQSIGDVPTEFPVKILQNDAMELWHRKDEKFKLPMAVWYIALKIPSPLKTAKEKMKLGFFLNLLTSQIAEDTWPAKQVKLSYKLSGYYSKGVVIKVNGLNEKIPILIDLLMKHLKLFTSNLTEETFAAVKDLRMKALYNKFLDPARSAEYFSKKVPLKCFCVKFLWRYLNGCDGLKNNYHCFDEAMREITLKDMKTFVDQLLKQLHVTVLVQGNVSAEEASLVAQKVVRDLHFKCKSKSIIPYIFNKNDNPQHQTQKISWVMRKILNVLFHRKKGETTYCVKSLNKSNTTSTVINYYQGDKGDRKTRMVLEMMALLIQGPLFDTLRTKEQLGYSVCCSVRNKFGSCGISVTVKSQAGKHSTKHVNERIDLFMKQMWKALSDMSESEFEEVKLRLIKKKQCSDNNLEEEAARNWSEIFFKREPLFDRLERQVEVIKELEKSDLSDWWKKHIFCEEKNKFTYRKMSTQVLGYGSQEDSTEASAVRAGLSGRSTRTWQGPLLFSSLVALFVICTRGRP